MVDCHNVKYIRRKPEINPVNVYIDDDMIDKYAGLKNISHVEKELKFNSTVSTEIWFNGLLFDRSEPLPTIPIVNEQVLDIVRNVDEIKMVSRSGSLHISMYINTEGLL